MDIDVHPPPQQGGDYGSVSKMCSTLEAGPSIPILNQGGEKIKENEKGQCPIQESVQGAPVRDIPYSLLVLEELMPPPYILPAAGLPRDQIDKLN